MIQLQDLRVVFGRTIALETIDADIPLGITGLFGPNGSGKSTLLRVLAGLLRPTHGRALVFGSDAIAKSEALRGRVGYVGHRSGLYGRLTVMENLELFAKLYGVAPERVEAAVTALGLEERRTTRAGDLSAGFKRRAAVARALLHDPDLLLLDEPYANLDDGAADLVTDAVVAWRGPDKIALIATHGAKKVKAIADGAVILQRGRMIRQGTYEATGFTT